MKRCYGFLLLLLPVLLVAQVDRNAPSIGYVFPAGASRGETVHIYIGGQKYYNVNQARITGEGVELEFVKRYPPMQNINGDQRKVLEWKMAKRKEALTGSPVPKPVANKYENMSEAERVKGEKLSHPLFDGIENMDTQGLQAIRDFLNNMKKRQYTVAIGDVAMFQLRVAEDAPLGERELRVESSRGLSNPLRFQVSRSIELHEREPNGPKPGQAAEPFELDAPIVWNGQVMPGDVDRFRIKATKGEHIVLEVLARRLVPYIADAVPGWFQPTLTIYDEQHNEIAFADDHLGSPDPILEFTAPREAEYTIEIRDSIYRGREDFVYRLFASRERLPENALRHADVSYQPSELPYVREQEPNSDIESARHLALSACISGVIDAPGDTDWIAFEGRGGSTVVAEIEARRFDSPLDSVLRLVDQSGKMIAFNDDYMAKSGHVHTGPGLQTHHADSYLSAELPEDGRYYVVVEDAQSGGSDAHKYRLRVSQPEPEYEVRVSPSAINFGPTTCAALHVWVNRKDGFEGPVELVPADPDSGLIIDGAFIPSGQDEAWVTLRVKQPERYRTVPIHLLGRAVINDKEVSKPVVPTDNRMQAFLWRHLVPAQELRSYEWAGYKRLKLPRPGAVDALEIEPGAKQTIQFSMPNLKDSERYSFKLGTAPKGLRLEYSKVIDDQLQLTFSCDEDIDLDRKKGNLIVEVFFQSKTGKKKSLKKKQTPQMMGVLPAIPYRIIES